jgi:hypothetical protein
VGTYSGSGVGLGTGGDAVNLYNGSGVLQANVSFGNSPTGPSYPTFDNAIGRNNTSIPALSASGINGAFAALNHSVEIGSPGTIGAPATPSVSVVASDAIASEIGPDSGTFRFTRTGSTINQLTVNFTLASGDGRANGSDFTPALTSVVTIPAGQSFVDVTLTPVADNVLEGTETLLLTIGDSGSYDVGSTASATISIADNPVIASVPALSPWGLLLCMLGMGFVSYQALPRRRSSALELT